MIDPARHRIAEEGGEMSDVVEKVLERRRNIYLVKRDKFDALAEDTETRWERYDFAAEAIEWLAGDLGISLPDRPDDPRAAIEALGGEQVNRSGD